MSGILFVLISALLGQGIAQLNPSNSNRNDLSVNKYSNSNSRFGVNLQSHDMSTNSSCGSLIEYGNWSGVISYKPFEKVNAHERCVWAIRGKTIGNFHTTGFVFKFYNLDVDEKNLTTGVIITVFSSQGYHSNLYPKEIDQYYSEYGNVALVTFYSDDSLNYRGFSLNFTHITSESFWSDPVSSNSKDMILSDTYGYVSYPPYEYNSTQDGNELSTFIITPNFRYNPSQILNVRYTGWGFETCDDYLDVFGFSTSTPIITNATSTNDTSSHWMYYGKICEREQQVRFSNTDMILLVFHSSSNFSHNSTDVGFYLSYELFPKPLYKNSLV